MVAALCVAGFLTVLQRANGLVTPMYWALPNSTATLAALGKGRSLPFEQDESYSLGFGKQGPSESGLLRLVYSSLVVPKSVYDINLATGKISACRLRISFGNFALSL
jgi:protease II